MYWEPCIEMATLLCDLANAGLKVVMDGPHIYIPDERSRLELCQLDATKWLVSEGSGVDYLGIEVPINNLTLKTLAEFRFEQWRKTLGHGGRRAPIEWTQVFIDLGLAEWQTHPMKIIMPKEHTKKAKKNSSA